MIGILKRYRENKINFFKKEFDRFIQDETEIRKKRIESRQALAEKIIETSTTNPQVRQTINMEKLSEFVSDENKSMGVKRIIALWVTLGYLITNLVIIGLSVFPISFLFRIYLIFAFVSTGVILSYFYTSFKMNNFFKLI